MISASGRSALTLRAAISASSASIWTRSVCPLSRNPTVKCIDASSTRSRAARRRSHPNSAIRRPQRPQKRQAPASALARPDPEIQQGGTTMGSWLSEREQRLVAGAETASAATPIPTQIVSNGEYLPPPQSETQKRVEQRIMELADANGKKIGLSRRQFMQTSCGMAAAFLAMQEIYGGNVFQVDEA